MYKCECGNEFKYPRIEIINDDTFDVVCPMCKSTNHNCGIKFTEKSSVVKYARQRKFVEEMLKGVWQ